MLNAMNCQKFVGTKCGEKKKKKKKIRKKKLNFFFNIKNCLPTILFKQIIKSQEIIETDDDEIEIKKKKILKIVFFFF